MADVFVYVETPGVLGRLRADARGQARAQRRLLRGADAVHLASALQVSEHGPLLFATWDARLAAAASSEGLATLPVR